MGFRFRKSFNAGPFRINLSKSGVGYSFGGKGARITKKANGNIQTTVGIPGSGMYYTKEHKNSKNNSTAKSSSTPHYQLISEGEPTKTTKLGCLGWFFSILLFPISLFWLIPIYTKKQSIPVYKMMPSEIKLGDVLPLKDNSLLVYLKIIDFIVDKGEWNTTFKANDINACIFDEFEITTSMLNELYDKGYLYRDNGIFTLNTKKFKYYCDMTTTGKLHPLDI